MCLTHRACLLIHKVSTYLFVDDQVLTQQPADFTEGVYIDYRHFIAKNITPRYEFGYGLSYTTFKYSDLDIAHRVANAKALAVWPEKLATLPGGNPALFKDLTKVEAKVQNTGNVASAEVAQLYVGIPGDTPARQLRGFSKPYLEPGQTKTVSFDLRRKDLSVWNVQKQEWELRRGTYNIYVGSSVLDIKLKGWFTLSESGFTVEKKFLNSTTDA
jgi:beta-glucosidase